MKCEMCVSVFSSLLYETCGAMTKCCAVFCYSVEKLFRLKTLKVNGRYLHRAILGNRSGSNSCSTHSRSNMRSSVNSHAVVGAAAGTVAVVVIFFEFRPLNSKYAQIHVVLYETNTRSRCSNRRSFVEILVVKVVVLIVLEVEFAMAVIKEIVHY